VGHPQGHRDVNRSRAGEYCSYDVDDRGVGGSGRWVNISTGCKQLMTTMERNKWLDLGGPWCVPKAVIAKYYHQNPPNPIQIYKPTNCQVKLMSTSAIRRCLSKRRVLLIGDSTIMEIYQEFGLRVLGSEYKDEYNSIYPEPTPEEVPSSKCIPASGVQHLSIALSETAPCYRLPLNPTIKQHNSRQRTSENNLSSSTEIVTLPGSGSRVDHYSMPVTVFRYTNSSKPVDVPSYGKSLKPKAGSQGRGQGGRHLKGKRGARYSSSWETEIAHVMYKSPNMRKNFGGAGSLGKSPLSEVADTQAQWADYIVVNNVLHSMGRKRSMSMFQDSRDKAIVHFNNLRDKYLSEMSEMVLPKLRKWAKSGKEVLWWSGNRPARIGTRPLLQEFFPMFVDAAREAIRNSNQNHPDSTIRWVDSSMISESMAHNTSYFTDGVHFGAWAILPKHKAKSSLVAKMTSEMILDAMCGKTTHTEDLLNQFDEISTLLDKGPNGKHKP